MQPSFWPPFLKSLLVGFVLAAAVIVALVGGSDIVVLFPALAVIGLFGFLAVRGLAASPRKGGAIGGFVTGVVLGVAGFYAFILVIFASAGPHGRPLRVGRRLYRGRVAAGAASTTADGLSYPTRRLLARLWAGDAALEHASVAAFEHLARRLSALEAPPDLVRRARVAAAEEADHARRTLALAQRFRGRELTLAPLPALPDPAVADHPAALAALATECLVDGVLGEAWAAEAARAALADTTDPEARETLAVISRDEASHARHAEDVLDWCLAEGGASVREAVRATVRREAARPRFRGLPVLRLTQTLARFGRYREAVPHALDRRLRAARLG